MAAPFMMRTYDVNMVFFEVKKSGLRTLSMYPNAFNKSKCLIYSMCAHSKNEQPSIIKTMEKCIPGEPNVLSLLKTAISVVMTKSVIKLISFNPGTYNRL